jgi:ssDNA-binding Zn-finger/Zn-ribbon topoisomerase 1
MKVKLGQVCPSCNIGTIVERDGRYSRFYGCSSYPNCYFVSKDIPLSEREVEDKQAEEWARLHKHELDPVI